MWLVSKQVTDRIRKYPRSALRIAEDLGEMVLYTNAMFSVTPPQSASSYPGHSAFVIAPSEFLLELACVGVPQKTDFPEEDVMSMFDGTRDLVCVLTNGVKLLGSLICVEWGLVAFGLKHPVTKQPLWQVDFMKLLAATEEQLPYPTLNYCHKEFTLQVEKET